MVPFEEFGGVAELAAAVEDELFHCILTIPHFQNVESSIYLIIPFLSSFSPPPATAPSRT